MALNNNLKNPTKFDRNMQVCKLRMEKNMTITQLADIFNITKQRIQKILETNLDRYISENRNGRNSVNKN